MASAWSSTFPIAIPPVAGALAWICVVGVGVVTSSTMLPSPVGIEPPAGGAGTCTGGGAGDGPATAAGVGGGGVAGTASSSRLGSGGGRCRTT